MAIVQINYNTKSDINTTATPSQNKISAADLNEIKSVVNTNATLMGDLSSLNTTDKSSIIGAINEGLYNQKWRLYDTTINTDTIDIPTEYYDEILVIAYDSSTSLNMTISIPKLYINSLTTQSSFQTGYWQQGTAGGRASVVVNPTTSKMWLNFMYINANQVANTTCYWYIR